MGAPMNPVDLTFYIGAALTIFGLGFAASLAYERYLANPKTEIFPLGEPRELLNRANIDFVKQDLRSVDIIGYSVHSIYDPLRPLIDFAVRRGARVRFLMLSPSSTALREKVNLEHRTANLDAGSFLARSQKGIIKTAERIGHNIEALKHQANRPEASCSIRVYDTMPIYRAIITNNGSLVSSYLDDLRKPAGDFRLIDLTKGHEFGRLEAQRARNWFNYVWDYRSRPFSDNAILFDLYDTLIRIDPKVRFNHDVWIAEEIGVDVRRFRVAWSATRKASNTGELGSTFSRFEAVLEICRKKTNSELASRLAAAEHAFLAKNLRLAGTAARLLQELRVRSYKVGLVTNCSSSVMHALIGSQIMSLTDSQTFSFAVCSMKPDSHIYNAALNSLGCASENCIFVGDGNDDELEGASRVGLRTIRCTWYADNAPGKGDSVAGSFDDLALQIDREAQWQL